MAISKPILEQTLEEYRKQLKEIKVTGENKDRKEKKAPEAQLRRNGNN